MLEIETWLEKAAAARRPTSRPLVSLCYAQSLDGSIALQRGQPTRLSGPESSDLTHRLRAQHDAILIGVGTVLSDDPLLTARLPGAVSPQPIVLDTHLRTPPPARVLRENPRSAWIACAESAAPGRRAGLERAGARLLNLPTGADGRIRIPSLLESLADSGIQRIMVEGGASVITAFLAAGLVDALVLTVAPILLGGLNALQQPSGGMNNTPLPVIPLSEVEYIRLGDDWIVAGIF